MKKIFKSSVLLLVVCFFAGKVSAQLSSEKPAMTAQQTADLLKSRSATKSTPAPTVALASQSGSSTMPARVATPAAEAKEVVAPATTASGSALPAVSDQGGVKPAVTEAPVAKPASAEPAPAKVVEPKLPAVPMQDQKTKTKD